MTFHRIGVQFGSAQSIGFGHVLGRLRHALHGRRVQNVIRERYRKIFVVIVRHALLHVVHIQQAPIEFRNPVGFPPAATAAKRTPHALDAEGDAAVTATHHDRRRNLVKCFHGGTTLAVGIEGTNLERQSRKAAHGAKPRKLAATRNVTESDVMDHRVFDFGILIQQCPQYRCTHFVQPSGHQTAPPPARERRPGAVHQYHIS